MSRSNEDVFISHVKNRTPVLVFGDSGTGKTTFVKQNLSEIDCQVRYYRCSNKKKEWFNHIKKEVAIKAKEKTVFVLDNLEDTKLYDLVIKIITASSINALVLIGANKWKLPKKVLDRVATIELKKKYVNDIKKIVDAELKQRGKKLDRTKITRDLRSSLNASIYNSDSFDILNGFTVTREVFAKNVSNFNFKEYGLWIMENAIDLLNGRKLFEALEVIETAYNLNRKEVLKHLPQVKGNINYPEFFRMRKGRK